MSSEFVPVGSVEILPPSGIEAVTRGEIDIQISTAKRFPRSIQKFRKDARGMATVDEDTATSCFYVVPRAGKKIEGPSVRLAEIVGVCYGNIRVVRRVIAEDERFVTCAAYCWDLENNVLQASEVRRRITDKEGGRYSDDMIATTINAGLAIAGRNATFLTVPRTYINDIYEDCKKAARGTIATLSTRRQKALEWFQGEAKIDPKTVFAGLGVRGIEDITIEHLEILQGIRTAIREGEVKADDAFASTVVPTGAGDPVGRVMGEIGCTEGVALHIISSWEVLKVPEAGRVVQMKRYAGKAADLIELLVSMGAPEPGTVEQPPAPAPKGKRAPRATPTPTPAEQAESFVAALDPAPDKAEEAAIDAAAAQQTSTKPTGKFAF